MKTATLVGIMLVVAGLFVAGYGGISWKYPKNEKSLERAPYALIVGALTSAAGVALVFTGTRKTA